jgi:hypothetical protein
MMASHTEQEEKQMGTFERNESEVIIKMTKSQAERLLRAIERALSIISEA